MTDFVVAMAYYTIICSSYYVTMTSVVGMSYCKPLLGRIDSQQRDIKSFPRVRYVY